MNRPRRSPAFLPLLLAIAATAAAGGAEPGREVSFADPATRFVHRQWTVADGLPVDALTDVVQTADGWLWIGTFDGLLRFDGARFTRFDTVTSPALRSNRVVQLEAGRDGALWILSELGHLSRHAGGRFRAVEAAAGASPRPKQMAFDTAGQLWLATATGLYRAGDDRIEPGPGELDERFIQAVGTGGAGRVWIATGDSRLAAVEGDRVRWIGGIDAGEDFVQYLAEDAGGALWIGTDNGLYRWPDGAPEAERVADLGDFRESLRAGRLLAPPEAATGHGPAIVWEESARSEHFLQPGPRGGLWESTGIALLHDGREVLALPEDGRPGIRALAFDHEATAWIATGSQGLHALQRARVAMLGEAEGLPNGNVYPIHQDRRGTVWIGDAIGGLSRLDGGALTAVGGTGIDTVFSIYDDPGSGLLLIGSAGIQRVAGSERVRLADVTVAPGGPPFDDGPIRAMLRTRDGRLLLGRDDGLLESRPGDPGADGWVFSWRPESAGWRVRALLEGDDGSVWLGTNGDGVALRRGARLRRLTTADGLSSDLVRALHLDTGGGLWIATEDRGLIRLEVASLDGGSGPEVAVIQKRDGLWDDALHRILEDDAGWLWMSTNRGVFRVRRSQLEDFVAGRVSRVDSVAYTEQDGMRNREANGGVQDAGMRARDGRLWFPTQDGVAIFDPVALVAGLPPPPVHVERLTAGDHEVIPGASDAVRLEARERSFEIEYTALSFRAPDRVRFRYRLAGYDQAWVEAGGRRKAFYTKVPPGSYTFEVQGRSAEGVWNREGDRLSLVVRPFYWETGWFRGAMAILLLAAVAGGFVQRERNQRARRRRLERQVAERTRELADERDTVARQADRLLELDRAKSELFANVSHEFRTPLTLSLGPLRDLVEGRFGALEAPVVSELERVRANSGRLLELVNQLLDVARLEAGGLTLRVARCDLGRFVRRLGERFVALAERRRIDFAFAVPEEAVIAVVDREQLDKALGNLLSNAFKFTPGGGRVSLALEPPVDGRVEIAVCDTGRGIPGDELPRIFDRFYRAASSSRRQVPGTGLGLALARDLVELHGGTLTVESTLGEGSTFTLRLPLGDLESAGEAAPGEPRTGGMDAPIPAEAPSEAELTASGIFDDDTAIADVTTVLVVDDHPDLRAYVRRHLEARYRVVEAGDGAAALAKARRVLPDLVVSDVMMPEMGGFELTRALKQDPELDFVPVVLLTARAEAEDKLAGLELGADDYLAKPFDVRELLARVDNLITQRRRLRERFAVEPPPRPALPLAPGARPTDDDRDFLERTRDALRDGLGEEGFNVEALAGRLHLDRTHLFRRLRELTGAAPSALILEARMKLAAQLLARDDGGVGEVAVAVGFKSVAHFSQRFRDRYGMTPSAYKSRRSPTS